MNPNSLLQPPELQAVTIAHSGPNHAFNLQYPNLQKPDAEAQTLAKTNDADLVIPKAVPSTPPAETIVSLDPQQDASDATLRSCLIHPPKAGEAGEAGEVHISNAEFIAAVFPVVPEGASVAVCAKSGDPSIGGWMARRAERVADGLSNGNNNYVGCSSFYPGTDGEFKAIKSRFAACHFFMLDDLGSKIPVERLTGIELSWLLETSPGNYQAGIILASPLTSSAEASRLHSAIIEAGLCDRGATGPASRWSRLPGAINGKAKYASEAGAPFACKLVRWNPEARYTTDQIIDHLGLTLPPAGRPKPSAKPTVVDVADDVLTPRAEENPVVKALKEHGLYKTPLGSGKHDVTCPWVHEHTDALDDGAAYFEPDEVSSVGGFCCQHSHRARFHIKELLAFLSIPKMEARHLPVIRVVAGSLHRVVDAAEQELAALGRHYQAGGLIVSVSTDPVTGNPSIIPTSVQALTRELSVAAQWESFDKRAASWVPCDPPQRHLANLFDAQSFRHLQPLMGVARQPYFRESDGALVLEPGYDRGSQRFGVFDARQFPIPDPTPEAARSALAEIEELLAEFHFVGRVDKAAALSAIFTAVVRPTLPHAPAFHVRAPVFGSGKTYLCELIGAFAGPAGNAKVSYPTTSEEATKAILSLLMTGPAVIEFDDMDTDWIPHGTIKRMLTAGSITDRILGHSKTATVSTRCLFLGSGNNVGPVRDLLRRVLTIQVDPRNATPATMTYKGLPVDRVHRNRGAYVTAVLTVILAWRAAGQPRTEADSIVTFSGAWSDYCRQPLMWLGHPDPATALIEQVRHDPDADALGGLMIEWHKAFMSRPTTVRKAVEKTKLDDGQNLLDAMREFPVNDRGEIDRNKLGWFLKKNANRIVAGREFQRTEADGRVAWRVVEVNGPPSPPSPDLHPARRQTVAVEAEDFIL